VIASKGGAPEHPAGTATHRQSDVEVQVDGEVPRQGIDRRRAERAKLWDQMVGSMRRTPPTSRRRAKIPVVVLKRVA